MFNFISIKEENLEQSLELETHILLHFCLSGNHSTKQSLWCWVNRITPLLFTGLPLNLAWIHTLDPNAFNATKEPGSSPPLSTYSSQMLPVF